MPDLFIKSFTHLKDQPKADQALHLLQRLASLVKPIMRKHGWTLPVLSEFYPEDPKLLGLNINSGEKILVRLRRPHAPDTFLDEESVTGTMLHELTHNLHAAHDEKFYKFLSGLEEEFEALRRSGYSGEGFYSAGRRLGIHVSHNLPPHLARKTAAEAAEKRKKISVITSGGGRLGGVMRSNKSPRELAAEAAERRARDENACASGAVAEREADKAARESVQDEVIDLTLSSDSEPEPEFIIIDEESPSPPSSSPSPSSSATATPRSASTPQLLNTHTHLPSSSSTSLSSLSSFSQGTMSDSARLPRPPVRRVQRGAGEPRPTLPKPRSLSRPPSRTHRKSTVTPPPTRTSSLVAQHNAGDMKVMPAIPTETQWTCPRCTLVNDSLALQCAACYGVRPGREEIERNFTNGAPRAVAAAAAPGWVCEVCGERDLPKDFWTCRFCGSVKAAAS